MPRIDGLLFILSFPPCLILLNDIKMLSVFSQLQSAQNRLLIKNGKVVNAEGVEDADVYIEEGIIK